MKNKLKNYRFLLSFLISLCFHSFGFSPIACEQPPIRGDISCLSEEEKLLYGRDLLHDICASIEKGTLEHFPYIKSCFAKTYEPIINMFATLDSWLGFTPKECRALHKAIYELNCIIKETCEQRRTRIFYKELLFLRRMQSLNDLFINDILRFKQSFREKLSYAYENPGEWAHQNRIAIGGVTGGVAAAGIVIGLLTRFFVSKRAESDAESKVVNLIEAGRNHSPEVPGTEGDSERELSTIVQKLEELQDTLNKQQSSLESVLKDVRMELAKRNKESPNIEQVVTFTQKGAECAKSAAYVLAKMYAGKFEECTDEEQYRSWIEDINASIQRDRVEQVAEGWCNNSSPNNGVIEAWVREHFFDLLTEETSTTFLDQTAYVSARCREIMQFSNFIHQIGDQNSELKEQLIGCYKELKENDLFLEKIKQACDGNDTALHLLETEWGKADEKSFVEWINHFSLDNEYDKTFAEKLLDQNNDNGIAFKSIIKFANFMQRTSVIKEMGESVKEVLNTKSDEILAAESFDAWLETEIESDQTNEGMLTALSGNNELGADEVERVVAPELVKLGIPKENITIVGGSDHLMPHEDEIYPREFSSNPTIIRSIKDLRFNKESQAVLLNLRGTHWIPVVFHNKDGKISVLVADTMRWSRVKDQSVQHLVDLFTEQELVEPKVLHTFDHLYTSACKVLEQATKETDEDYKMDKLFSSISFLNQALAYLLQKDLVQIQNLDVEPSVRPFFDKFSQLYTDIKACAATVDNFETRIASLGNDETRSHLSPEIVTNFIELKTIQKYLEFLAGSDEG